MPTSPVWTIKRGSDGLEQSAAAWGLQDLSTDFQAAGEDKVTCKAIMPQMDGGAIFNDFDTGILFRTDPVSGAKVAWFSGLWTKTPRNASGEDESISYELSGGPWWYLSHCVFQTEWNSTNGVSPALVPQLSALSIIGSNPDLASTVKLDLFAFMELILDYCISCGADQATPIVPFAVGTISGTDLIIPFEQVKNLTCAQALQHCLRWIPDATFWVDYSTIGSAGTGVPTINIVQRPNLNVVTLPAFRANGGLITKLQKITPRTDLQVTNVVCKYNQTSTIDGAPYATTVEDIYPVGSNQFNFRGLVASVDLFPGSVTFQKQNVVTSPLPEVGSGGSGVDPLTWCKHHIDWLFGTASAASNYDTANIAVQYVNGIDLWAQDPYSTGPAPTGFAVSEMTNELIDGHVTQWMTDDQNIFACYVIVSVLLQYTGSDPLTKALFTNTNTGVPNTRMFYIRVKATNAQTELYSQPSNITQGEAPPTGLAQILYNANSVLHYEGSIELTEQECSGLVKLGSVLNLTGSLAAWSTMIAQVISVSEQIDTGITTVRFGPSKNLSLDEYLDLLRALRVRQPSGAVNQRMTGDGSDNDIIGGRHSPHTSVSTAPGGGAGTPQPWDLNFKNVATSGSPSWQVSVNPQSVLQNTDNSQLAVTGADGSWSAITSASTEAWIEGTVASLATTAASIVYGAASTFAPYGANWTATGPTVNDGGTPPNQTLWRKLIATIDWSSGSPVATNVVAANLQLFNCALLGEAGVYPY